MASSKSLKSEIKANSKILSSIDKTVTKTLNLINIFLASSNL